MRSLFVLLALVVVSQAGAVETVTKELIYTGCTFEGLQAARRTCETAKSAINMLSNEKFSVSASCNHVLGSGTSFCIMGDISLTSTFYIY